MESSDVQRANEITADIASARERIDAIDDELIELLRKRIELSSLIMQTKPQTRIVDPTREQAILTRYCEKLGEVSTFQKTKRLVLGILGTARLYPESESELESRPRKARAFL